MHRIYLDPSDGLTALLIYAKLLFVCQMTVRTGIFHNPYVRRLLTHVVDATQVETGCNILA